MTNSSYIKNTMDKFKYLKKISGSHSPSLITILEKLPELKIKVDACFLSNPYATDLFIEYLDRELIKTGKIRDILEFYPSQNPIVGELLSQHLGVEKAYIFVGNGATEIIQAILHNFVGKSIIVIIPTFSPYYEFVRNDTNVIFFKLKKENNFLIDIDEYISFVKKNKPDSLVIINPNNPNGGYIKYKDLSFIIENVERYVNNIIIDESFIHFSFEDDKLELITSVNLFKKYPKIIILKSMSKDFGIAGVRAGYAIMEKEKVKTLLSNGYLWNINGIAEYFFRLYTRKDFFEKYNILRKKYIKETHEFFRDLSKIKNIKVYPSMANFALVEILKEKNADDLVAELLVKHGVYVRTGSDKLGLEGEFIRVASRKKEENKIIVSSIKNLLENAKK